MKDKKKYLPFICEYCSKSDNLLLRHVVNDVHDLFAECVSFLHRVCLRINADDGFSVTLAQVYPLVGKVNFHTVDVGHGFVLVEFLHLLQNLEDVGRRVKVDAVLGNVVLRRRVAQFGGTHTGFAKYVRMRAIPTSASRPE